MDAFLDVPNEPIPSTYVATVKRDVLLAKLPFIPGEARAAFEELHEKFEANPYEYAQEMAEFQQQYGEFLPFLRSRCVPLNKEYVILSEKPYEGVAYCFTNLRLTGDPFAIRTIELKYGGDMGLPVATIYPHTQGMFEPLPFLTKCDILPSAWGVHVGLMITPEPTLSQERTLHVEYDVHRMNDAAKYAATSHKLVYSHSWAPVARQRFSSSVPGSLIEWGVPASFPTIAVRVITTQPMKTLRMKNSLVPETPLALTETRPGRYVYEVRFPERIHFSQLKEEDAGLGLTLEAENAAEFEASVFLTSWNVLNHSGGAAGPLFC